MRAGAGSDTAIFTALQRAAHQILDDAPRILADPIAVGLSPGSTEEAIRERAAELQQPLMKVLRSNFVFRSRFAEDSLQQAVEGGVRQLVVLGAGFDTFAYRQPVWSRELRIFEVDHPASQALKKRRLEKLSIAVPANLSFCPVDFESVTLEVGLAAASFDFARPAFFSWLGVTQYLTQEAILATLRSVGGMAPGSQILFEVIPPDTSLPESEREVAKWAAQSSAARGEPWLTRFEPAEMRAHLAQLGYRSSVHLSTQEAQARYFHGRSDGLRPAPLGRLLVATV
jgi:methyltransferase (TIGR00027 family)